MPFDLQENGFRVVLVLLFVAALLLFEGVYLLWRAHRGPQARVLSRRLLALRDGGAHAQRVQVLKERAAGDVPAFGRWVDRLALARTVERLALQADLQWTASRLLLASTAFGVGTFLAVAVLAFQRPATSLAAGAAGACLPWLWLAVRRARRLARLQRQLPDALDFITRSLRSGMAFTATLATAGEELADPIAAEFRAANDEITFGVSLPGALANLAERVPLTDVRFFVVAVLIQRDSGGNLSEVLANLSRLIRERSRLRARIRVLSADARLSAGILVAAPFALGAVMHASNPEFMSLLWRDPIGIGIVKTLGLLMLVGVVILQRIVRIRV